MSPARTARQASVKLALAKRAERMKRKTVPIAELNRRIAAAQAKREAK